MVTKSLNLWISPVCLVYNLSMRMLIENASVSFGGTEVLKKFNMQINDGEKIAIIGGNGAGKTTLLKLISGEILPDAIVGQETQGIRVVGDTKIGYMKQATIEDANASLQEELLKAYKHILKIKEDLEKQEQIISENPSEKEINKYVELQQLFELNGGYTYQKEYNSALTGFGFSEEDKLKKLSQFSGGQQTKIALLKLLLSKPDILILDEPTNHLDIKMIEWLEQYLLNYKKVVIIVSHDRLFIDKVSNIVYELENGKMIKYVGNYTKFVETKQQKLLQQEKEYKRYEEEVNRLQGLADRFRYKATKAAMAQSKLKQIERLEVVEKPTSQYKKSFRANIQPQVESSNEVIKFDKLQFGYSNAFGEISGRVYKGDRVAIIGANGTGKSTLLKTIVGLIPLIGGKIKFGQNLEIGYFDQQTAAIKATNETILENYQKEFPYLTTQEARTDLGAFLFTQDEVHKDLSCLSGGELVRLALCKILKKKPNFLILDEPTNHMDINSRETLEELLSEYRGTILFVSHDRYFVKKLATGIIAFDEFGCNYYYNTSYHDYMTGYQRKLNSLVATTKEVVKNVECKPAKNKQPEKQRQKEVARLEKKILILESEIKALNNEYNNPDICSDVDKLLEIQDKILVKQEELDKLNEDWFNLMEE